MSTSQAAVQTPEVVNGIEVDKIMCVINNINADANNGKWQFRSENKWMGAAKNQSEFKDYLANNGENIPHVEPFILKADEPPLIGGNGDAANPVEFLLHALTSCLTTSLVAHAAVRGIVVEDINTSTEGDIDIRGFLGMSEGVRKGYQAIRITMKVKSKASAETLRELALFSPVYDVVSNSLPVEFNIETYS
jgi:uncharacterized OsmC-like protein